MAGVPANFKSRARVCACQGRQRSYGLWGLTMLTYLCICCRHLGPGGTCDWGALLQVVQHVVGPAWGSNPLQCECRDLQRRIMARVGSSGSSGHGGHGTVNHPAQGAGKKPGCPSGASRFSFTHGAHAASQVPAVKHSDAATAELLVTSFAWVLIYRILNWCAAKLQLSHTVCFSLKVFG